MASLSSQTPRSHFATFADLLLIPEEERYHEVLDGEVRKKLLPSFRHGLGQGGIIRALSGFQRRPNGPSAPGGWWIVTEVEIELARHQVVRPDVAGWRRDRLPVMPEAYPMDLRPDWVCEVFTDGDGRRRDSLLKRRIYSDHEIPHYWLLDTGQRQLTVLRLEKRGYVEVLAAGLGELVRAEPFEALEIPVALLFGEDPE